MPRLSTASVPAKLNQMMRRQRRATCTVSTNLSEVASAGVHPWAW
jgi:hypothetical protein